MSFLRCMREIKRRCDANSGTSFTFGRNNELFIKKNLKIKHKELLSSRFNEDLAVDEKTKRIHLQHNNNVKESKKARSQCPLATNWALLMSISVNTQSLQILS